jgi:hypothetical protein
MRCSPLLPFPYTPALLLRAARCVPVKTTCGPLCEMVSDDARNLPREGLCKAKWLV